MRRFSTTRLAFQINARAISVYKCFLKLLKFVLTDDGIVTPREQYSDKLFRVIFVTWKLVIEKLRQKRSVVGFSPLMRLKVTIYLSQLNLECCTQRHIKRYNIFSIFKMFKYFFAPKIHRVYNIFFFVFQL